MKLRNLFLSAALAVTSLSSALISMPMPASQTTIIEIGQGGTLDWNGSFGSGLSCKKDGSDCKITITERLDNVVGGGSGGSSYWHIEGQLQSGVAYVTPSAGSPFNQSIGVNGYMFDTGYLVVQASWYTGVPAMLVPVVGQSADASGYMSFNVLQSACIY